MQRGGTAQFQSVAAEATKSTIILNPLADRRVMVCGVDISSNAAPDSTVAPQEWRLKRTGTALPTASANTPAPFDHTVALLTAGLEDATVEGTLIDVCKRWYVPNVSGLIWQARPGEEYMQADITAVGAIGLEHLGTLPSGVQAISALTFLE